MNSRFFFSSLTRITDLQNSNIEAKVIPQSEWATADYVVGEVGPEPSRFPIELANGRMIVAAEGDLVIGAFGKRHATLEATGDWKKITQDGYMDMLTGAGLLGKCTSRSALLPPLLALKYRGHVFVDGQKKGMQDYVKVVPEHMFNLPVILIIGTSMSAGKTTVGRIIVNQLKKEGLKVIAAKFTGAGRYRDILSLRDGGADHIFDFVDVGLPSSICSEERYKQAAIQLLSRMAAIDADVALIELGASPQEPYNAKEALEILKENIACTILCSSDPYAVVGVMSAFGLKPDFVSGVTTSTIAGVELVEQLAWLPAINVLNKQSHPALRSILKQKLFQPSQESG